MFISASVSQLSAIKNNGKSNQSITSHKVIKSQNGLGCKGHLKSV